uniref:Thioredoxin domain-containing protein n=2 Tax=Aquisalinus luteolus TaxID=1566827 RepID=A0A8J3A527_9PROT|nr:hypothetical protein GCM10011355_04940 [Aquisalinus luteolus]
MGQEMPESENKQPSAFSKYLQPRFLLLVWMGLGAVFLAFISISAMIPSDAPRPGTVPVGSHRVGGEMADFTPAFPPRKAPQVAFTGPEGQVSLADFRGQVVLVNLWATWCAPCLEEMPSLNALQKKMGGDDFQVVAIAAEPRAEEKALRFFDEHGIDTLALYSDPLLSFATTMGGSTALPVSVLYDAKGNELGRLVGGADWASDDAVNLINAAIAGREIKG